MTLRFRRPRRLLAWEPADEEQVEPHFVVFVPEARVVVPRLRPVAGPRWSPPMPADADSVHFLDPVRLGDVDASRQRSHSSPAWSRHLVLPAAPERVANRRFEDAAVECLPPHARWMDRAEEQPEQRWARSASRVADQVLPGRRCRPTWTVSLLTCAACCGAAGARASRRCELPTHRLTALRRLQNSPDP